MKDYLIEFFLVVAVCFLIFAGGGAVQQKSIEFDCVNYGKTQLTGSKWYSCAPMGVPK